MKLLGRIELWYPNKPTGPFGFVTVNNPVMGGGFAVDRYFLHASRIVYVMSEVKTGCLVRFDAVKAIIKKQNAYPVCVLMPKFSTLRGRRK